MKYHKEKGCIEIIKKLMHIAWHVSPTNEYLVEHSKFPCTKDYENKIRTKETCKLSLSFCIESLREQRSENSGKNGDEVTTKINRRSNLNRNKDNKKEMSMPWAIIGTSVGVTSIIILFLIILIIIFVCRRRSKKKKREQLSRLQSIDQRSEMANLESGTSSTNNEGHNMLSTYTSLNTGDAPGQYCVLDPSFTQFEEAFNSQLSPEVIRFGVAEGDENVYHEID